MATKSQHAQLEERARDLTAFAGPGDLVVDRGSHAPAAAPVLRRPTAPSRRRARIFSRKSLSDFAGSCRNALVDERDRGGGFVLAPVLLGAGAVTYFSLATEPDFSAIGLGLAVLACLLFAARNRYVVSLALAGCLMFVGGMMAGKLETARKSATMLGSAVTTTVTGTITQMETLSSGRTRMTIAVASTSRPKLRYQPKNVRLSAARLSAGMAPGVTVTGLARLFPARGPLTQDGYDFAFQNYFDSIGANGFFMGSPNVVSGAPAGSLWLRANASIERLRLSMHERIVDTLPGQQGNLASALITGMKRGIADETNETLRKTGLAHILSISGLHMALAAGTVMGLLRAFFGLFPDFTSTRPVRKYAAGAALVGAACYFLISGAGVATQRSFVMLAVMLAAVMLDRAAITMRNLAIAAMIMIAMAPHEIMGPSFQMSFAATAALVAAYGYWSEWKANRPPPVPAGPVRTAGATIIRYTSALIVTSLVAGLATMVFAAFHFHRIAPLGLPANLFAMPVISVLVMPSAVIAVLLMPFDLDGIPLMVMGQGISFVIAIAGWFSDRTLGDVVGLIPVGTLAATAIALIIATIATTRFRWASVPFLVIAIVLLADRKTPRFLVTEDAGLVAVLSDTGTLAVSTARENEFVLSDWRRSLRAKKVVLADQVKSPDAKFQCSPGICVYQEPNGITVAHIVKSERIDGLCPTADIIVMADPEDKQSCPAGEARIVSARDLARYGTATGYFDTGDRAPANVPRTSISHVLGSIDRPWHRHRAFSRAARGLGERKKTSRGQKQRRHEP